MALDLGYRLGRYDVLARLGAGGMGEVYRAFDTTLRRDVAIKILRPGGDGGPRRLLREAQSAAGLDHPNICTVHEIGQDGDLDYIVMQFVEGETLAARIAQSSVPLPEAIAIAGQIAGALAEAHQRGIVHRDIKPANIMLAPGGQVKVLDFGLATTFHALGGESTQSMLTAAGAVAGTLAYMSPEQIRGEDLDPRSDLFSFGILLYEMISRAHPFSAPTNADVISAILTRDPLPFPAIASVPIALSQIVWTCLEKDRAKRRQFAAEIASDLAAIRAKPSAISGQNAEHSVPQSPSLAATTGPATFVGRRDELASLTTAWDQTLRSNRSLLMIAGEPGMGKTRLCIEFARQCAAAGAIVLAGRSDEQALVPYQPFLEALGWYVRTCRLEDLLAHLDAAGGGAELGLLLPELRQRVPSMAAPAEVSPEAQRYRMFEAVAGLLSAISVSWPVLLLLDDLHWADEPSLLLLRHLARSRGAARLSIAVNYRDSEAKERPFLSQMLADLRREPSSTRVLLGGLTTPQVGELVSGFAAGAPRHLVQAVAESSGGNPFFAAEMVRHLVETGAFAVVRDTVERKPELGVPEGVRDVIRRRLSRMTEDCRRVLTAAAVIGQEFGLPLVETLAGTPEDRLLDVIEEAVRAQLIVEAGGDRCRFAHALIRETLYDELSGPRRARMHRKAGQAIEELAKSNPPLADLAYHFSRAAAVGGAEKAVEYALQAANRAEASLALEEAIRMYTMALDVMDIAMGSDAIRTDFHYRRGRMFRALGRWAPAKDDFARAHAGLRGEPTELACELLVELTEASFWAGDEVPIVEKSAQEAIALVERFPARVDLLANAQSCLARCREVSGDLDEAISLDHNAMQLTPGQPNMPRKYAAIVLYKAGRLEESVTVGRQNAEIARSSQDAIFTMYALPHFAMGLAGAGKYAEAHQVFEEARAFGTKYGATGPLARVLSFAAGLHLSVFDYAGAAGLQQESRELARSAGMVPPLVSSGIDMLLTFARTHNPGAAESLLPEIAAGATKHAWHRGIFSVRIKQARAELALARGEAAAALEEAVDAYALAGTVGRAKYQVLALVAQSEALNAVGRKTEAVEAAQRALTIARNMGDPSLRLRSLDVLLALDGDDGLLSEARIAVSAIHDALPDAMRRLFETSELVQRVRRL